MKESLNREALIKTLIITIEELLRNSSNQQKYEKTPFHGSVPPAVSIEEYMKRIQKYSYCSDSVYVMTVVYIDRLQQRNPEFVLNKYSMHRTLLTTFMVAAKFYDDFYFKNNYYAKIGGINKNQINSLQVSFLEMVNYDLFVSPEVFEMYFQKLSSYAMVNE